MLGSNKKQKGIFAVSLVSLAAAAVAAPAYAAEEDVDNISLEQRVLILERKLEIQKEEADAKAKDGAGVTAGDKGFSFKSNDGNFELKLRTLIQADGRFYTGEPAGQALTDTFLVRRVEPSFQGTLGKLIGFTFTPQFGASPGAATATAGVTDLFIDVKFDPAATLRVGRFKGPATGLENLQPTGAIKFIERGLPTNLSPTRDYGVQLQGVLFDNTLSYAVGVFNGAPDGKDAPAGDADNRKEVEARIFAEPFKNSPGFFQGLGLGVAASHGQKLGITNQVPSYITTGQNTFFAYAGTTTSVGEQTRIQPQAYFYHNALGVIAEYTTSSLELASSAAGPTRKQDNTAWQVATTYLLTGEDASFNQPVRPSSPYKIGGEGWGAFEVGLRAGDITIDEDAFTAPALAAGAAAATNNFAPVSNARDYGVAFNWYPTVNLKLAANFDYTSFKGGTAAIGRPDERAIFVRAQVWY